MQAFYPNLRFLYGIRVSLSYYIIALSIPLLLVGNTAMAAPPPNFQTTQIIGSGIEDTSGFDIAPDGRIFILERTGAVKVYKNGAILDEPFVTLPSVATGDRGLMGIAFDPDYHSNHYVYFYYTGLDLLNRLVRFDASGDTAQDAGVVLYQTYLESHQLHVGGTIRFGPDGKLYLSIGDNGDAPAAQRLGNPHGKILRLNKDGTIPGDNPFVGQSGALPEIWAYGLRNPFRFQIDSATGRLFMGDVGNASFEEINRIEKGKNYGWPICEGPCGSPTPDLTDPIHYYFHDGGESRAAVGGPLYRGNMFPSEYRGSLFFGDYAGGFIKRLTLDSNGNSTGVQDFDINAGSVVDMKVASDGSLYYITYYPAILYRVTYSLTNQTPTANATADDDTGLPPFLVRFSSEGSFDPDGQELSYDWDFGDGTGSTDANPEKTYEEEGTFTVELTVSDGENTAQATPIVIQVGTPPNLIVAAPEDGSFYNAGDSIFYTASATDGAGFDLSDAAFTTEIIFHHGTHIHPFIGPIQSNTGNFTIPTTGEPAPDTWYEVKIKVTDENNLSAAKSVNIFPRKADVVFDTDISGLILLLDGITTNAPVATQQVIGFERELEVPQTQTKNCKTYTFDSWSDGGARVHTVTIPDHDIQYIAHYTETGTACASFTAQYWNTPGAGAAPAFPTGTPDYTITAPAVDFDWGGGTPNAAIAIDHFAARFTKDETFAAGTWRFTTTADDGVRLFVDGVLVLDKWIDQGATTYTSDVTLTAGAHNIKVEYYENDGGAVVKVLWDLLAGTPPPTTDFTAEFWNTPGAGAAPGFPGGAPNYTTNFANIDFNWGYGSPNGAVNADHFVARFTKQETFSAGTYRFTTTGDDGIRLFVDNVLVLDKWIDQGETAYTSDVSLTAGTHTVKLEYYDNTEDAVVRLGWELVAGTPPPTTGFTAEFWNTPGAGAAPAFPGGAPNYTTTAPAVDFDWGYGSPNGAVNADHFVARFTKEQTFSAGTYRFTTTGDDGVRLFVDNILVLDKWIDQGETAYTSDISLAAGTHTVKLEYYDNTEDAIVRLGWAGV